MKKGLFMCVVMLIPFLHQAQEQQGIALSFGGVASYTAFSAFKDYADTYNSANSGTSGFEDLTYNPFGFGMEGELQYRINGFYTGIRISNYKNLKSKSAFSDGERIFQFYSRCFDVKAGFTKKHLTFYGSLTIHSFNIESYYAYSNGIDSYGSDKYISGVYTSWKMQGCIGIRYEKQFKNLGYYLDFSLPVNAKKYLGGSFDKQLNATDEPVFPQDHNDYGTLDTDKALPQNYRNFRLGIGLIYYFIN